MGQELATLPVEQRAELALIEAGAKPLHEVMTYVATFQNIVELPVTDKETRDTHRAVEVELSGEIKEIEERCKAAGEDAYKLHKAVVAAKKPLLEPLETLKKTIEAKRKAYDAEIKAIADEKKNRVARITANIAELTNAPTALIGASSASIAESLELLKLVDLDSQENFGEFTEKAKEEHAKAVATIASMLSQAIAAEESQAKLAEMQTQQAEFERQKAEFAEMQRQAELAKQAAENARLQSEKDKAEAEAKMLREAEAKRQQEEAARIAAEAKAQADNEEEERQAALAPDKDKLIKYAADLLEFAGTNVPALQSKEANELFTAVVGRINSLAVQIQERAEKL